MACWACTLHTHALCHSIVHACQCVHRFFVCACGWGGGECEMQFSFTFTFIIMTPILWVIPNIAGLVRACTCCVSLFDMHEQNNLAPDAKINFDLFIFQMRKPCHDNSSLPVSHSGCKVRPIRTRDFSVGGFCHQDNPLCPLPHCCST